jgi:hypothetical protein
MAGGSVEFDCSNAFPVAKSVIDSPYARAKIAGALGMEAQNAAEPPQAQASLRSNGWGEIAAEVDAPPKEAGPLPASAMSIADISARLSADLLVSRLRASGDEEEDADPIADAPISHEAEEVPDRDDN